MKYFLIIISLVVVYLIIEAIFFYYKISTAPEVNIPEHEDLVMGTGYDLRYVAAGDSTAVGVGASSASTTYPNQIFAVLSRNNKVYYKNVAMVGAKTEDVLEKQLAEIIEYKPQIVTLSIGANDVTHLKSSKEILDNLKEIISEITQNTEATIYLTNIPNFSWAKVLPWFYRNLLEYRDSGINDEILKLENERVKIVNIHDFGWSKYPNLDVTNAPDKFHPNDAGYQNWAEAFLSRLLP